LALSGAVVFTISCSQLAAKQETYFGKEVLDVPSNYTLQQVVKKAEETLAVRATNIQKFVGFMPDKLPEQPGQPNFSVQDYSLNGLGGFTYASISCGKDAVAVLRGEEPELNSGLGTSKLSGYTVCIYPYTGGYRVYLIGAYVKNTSNPIGGFITGLIQKAVSKATKNCENMTDLDCMWNQIVEASKKEFKGAKILQVEYPNGGPKATSNSQS
jgi:hypothetical protein